MRISAENEADRPYRVVRKADGTEVPYVVEADTATGTYKQLVMGADKRLTMTHTIVRSTVSPGGEMTHYDEFGNECGEPEPAVREVAEPFRVVHWTTREVVAETDA